MHYEFDVLDYIETDFYTIIRKPPHTEGCKEATWEEIINMIANRDHFKNLPEIIDDTHPA